MRSSSRRYGWSGAGRARGRRRRRGGRPSPRRRDVDARRCSGNPHSSRAIRRGSSAAHRPCPSQRVQSTTQLVITAHPTGRRPRTGRPHPPCAVWRATSSLQDVERRGDEPRGAVGMAHAPRPHTSPACRRRCRRPLGVAARPEPGRRRRARAARTCTARTAARTARRASRSPARVRRARRSSGRQRAATPAPRVPPAAARPARETARRRRGAATTVVAAGDDRRTSPAPAAGARCRAACRAEPRRRPGGATAPPTVNSAVPGSSRVPVSAKPRAPARSRIAVCANVSTLATRTPSSVRQRPPPGRQRRPAAEQPARSARASPADEPPADSARSAPGTRPGARRPRDVRTRGSLVVDGDGDLAAPQRGRDGEGAVEDEVRGAAQQHAVLRAGRFALAAVDDDRGVPAAARAAWSRAGSRHHHGRSAPRAVEQVEQPVEVGAGQRRRCTARCAASIEAFVTGRGRRAGAGSRSSTLRRSSGRVETSDGGHRGCSCECERGGGAGLPAAIGFVPTASPAATDPSTATPQAT